MRQSLSFAHVALFMIASGFIARSVLCQGLRSLDPAKNISQYVLETWSEDEGLPQTSVSSIVSTSDGYLWAGTQEGLVRYNGIDFQVFDKGTSSAFSEDHIVKTMLVDSKQRLWIGLGQGLILYEASSFRNIRLPDGQTVKSVTSIIEGEGGTIHIATESEGIYYVDGLVLRKDEFLSGIQSGYVSSLLSDPAGGFWLGTEEALFRVINKQVKKFTESDGIPGSAGNLVNTLYRDRQGTVWIGASGGAAVMTANQKLMPPDINLGDADIRTFLEDASGTLWIGTAARGLLRATATGLDEFTADGELSEQAIISFHVDQEGSLWIGTDGGGLSRLRAAKFTTFTKNEGLLSNVVYTVFEDADEGIWIGTEGGGLTHLYKGQTTTYTTKNGLAGDFVSSVAGQADGTIWVGMYGTGLDRIQNGTITHFGVNDGLPGDEVTVLYVDDMDQLWIGTNSGIAHFDDGTFTTTSEKDGLIDNFITAIKEDHEGSLWIGTYANGLSRITDDGIHNYTVENGLPNDQVFSFLMDDDDVVWIGTYGGGIARYKDGAFFTISMRDGLFNDYIYKILESDDGMLWMTCNKGIFRVHKDMLNDFADGRIGRITSEVFNRDDGLKGNEMNGGFQPAGWKGADGRLWFPSMRGVAMINPTDIRLNETIPQVHIESFIVDGKVFSGIIATFSSAVEKIEFKFASLSFESPGKNLYDHRLLGYMDTWERASGQSATYTNLDPGTYEFQVRASNNDGLWNNVGDSLTFQLRPRFFETIWFILLCIFVVVALAVFLYRFRISQLNQRQAELERERDKARAANRFTSVILDNLNHEFRTPLTVILGCTDILLSELSGAEIDFAADIKSHGNRLLNTLDSLLELARIQKDNVNIEWEEVDISEIVSDLVIMNQAMAKEKEIVLSLAVSEDVTPVLLQKSCVEYAIRAVMENALKFTEDGSVRISVCRESDNIVVRMADTGMGISRSDFELIFEPFKQASEGLDRKYEGAGVGLTVARQLVQSMQGTLELESSGVDGSTFVLCFPTTIKRGLQQNRLVIGEKPHVPQVDRSPIISHASRLKIRLRSDESTSDSGSNTDPS